mgnify:CR=1 FL=1
MMGKNILIAIVLLLSWHAFAKDLPVDTAEYIYGLGTDNSYAGAQKAALADMAQKLSTRVQSNTEIMQRKEGNTAKTVAINRTQSYSRDIELPNVEVIENDKRNGVWTIIVKASRTNIQQALKHQLNNLHQELTFVLGEFDRSYGPACFYALSEKLSAKEKLMDLVPAYVGSGAKDNAERAIYVTLQQFDKTIRKCEQRNKYRLSFSTPVSKFFENEVKKFLKSQGYIVTKSPNNTGEIQFILNTQHTVAYENHLAIVTVELIVLDEFEEMRSENKFKVKGSSFDSKENALKRAHQNLIKKLKLII